MVCMYVYNRTRFEEENARVSRDVATIHAEII